MDDYQRLLRHRRIWESKKILRIIYSGWYKKIVKDLRSGKTLEIGSGIGNFKNYYPEIISSDIIRCDWLDMCFDAHHIPFPDNSLGNIVLIDVFHHFENPIRFLNEAYRVLAKNGRLIMIEPFPSLFSLFVYKIFHPEPFIFKGDVFSVSKDKHKKTPWSSNQAIPFLLFFKKLDKFNQLFKGKFKIIKREKFSFILYALSGGFENKQLIPNWLFPFAKIVEKLLFPLRELLAFRCYIILQKNRTPLNKYGREHFGR